MPTYNFTASQYSDLSVTFTFRDAADQELIDLTGYTFEFAGRNSLATPLIRKTGSPGLTVPDPEAGQIVVLVPKVEIDRQGVGAMLYQVFAMDATNIQQQWVSGTITIAQAAYTTAERKHSTRYQPVGQLQERTQSRGEKLDYVIDYIERLIASNDGDTIATSAWAIENGGDSIDVESDDNDSYTSTVWVQSSTTAGRGALINTVTTAGGRVFKARLPINVV